MSLCFSLVVRAVVLRRCVVYYYLSVQLRLKKEETEAKGLILAGWLHSWEEAVVGLQMTSMWGQEGSAHEKAVLLLVLHVVEVAGVMMMQQQRRRRLITWRARM